MFVSNMHTVCPPPNVPLVSLLRLLFPGLVCVGNDSRVDRVCKVSRCLHMPPEGPLEPREYSLDSIVLLYNLYEWVRFARHWAGDVSKPTIFSFTTLQG